MRRTKTGLMLIVSASAISHLLVPTAGADPVPLPDPPPYLPGAPTAEPGSFDYPYNVIAVGPPPATDSRGVRIGSNVDPPSQSTGLPGSRLGNGEQAPGPFVTSNSRYGISGGLELPGPANPGIDARAGVSALPSAEDPAGHPPSQFATPEAAAPTEDDLPGYPPPLLELPGNPHSTADGPPLSGSPMVTGPA